MNKFVCYIAAVVLACASADLETTGGSGLTWNLSGTAPGDITYAFDVAMGAKDRWNPETQESPPLEPGKAIQLAKEFIQQVPLGGDWKEWRLEQVQMLRSVDPKGLEEWLYVVRFYAVIPGTLTTGGPVMNVPIRMDGTIPDSVISKPKA